MKIKKMALAMAAMLTVTAIATGCGNSDTAQNSSAADGNVVYTTYGQPDDWANWKGIFDKFCSDNGITRADTDMSSAEEIEKFNAEKNNPQADSADIGMVWGTVAVEQGVTMAYKNANWDKIPDWAKDKDGNWFGSYVGVPVFLVNTDIVKDVPQSWEDLKKPEYKNSVVISNPQTSGTGQNTVLAAAYALTGDISNIDAAVEYFNEIDNAGNFKDIDGSAANIQKGEVPITILYDFNAYTLQKKFKDEVNLEIVFPEEGSIYAPSALMLNKYAPHPEYAQKFADFLSSDEGQLLFAEGGAMPIRYVAGNLEIPDDIKENMLPDDFYGNCGAPENWNAVSPELIAQKWADGVVNQ